MLVPVQRLVLILAAEDQPEELVKGFDEEPDEDGQALRVDVPDSDIPEIIDLDRGQVVTKRKGRVLRKPGATQGSN